MLAQRRLFQSQQQAKLIRKQFFILESTAAAIVSDPLRQDRDRVRQAVDSLKACGRSKDLQRGRAIHRTLGEEPGIFISTALVDMYGKCGCLAAAREVFDKMPHRDPVSWNAIINGYAQAGAAESALELYESMQQGGFVPTGRTFVAALGACASLAVKEDGKQIQARVLKLESAAKGAQVHSRVCRTGNEEDVFVASTLIDLHAKCGLMIHAQRVFDSIQIPSVVSWTAMIMGYAQNGESEMALDLFAAMRDQTCSLDARTFVAALIACAALAVREDGRYVDCKLVKVEALRKGRNIHSLLDRDENKQKLNNFVRNALVDMYAKCGSMSDAREVFDRASCFRDVVLWNSIIHGYAQCGESNKALEMFSRMQDLSINPDARTFVAAICACSSLAASEEARNIDGKIVKVVALERGRSIHSQIKKLGPDVAADIYVANSLLDMYAKCGSLAEAMELFKSMQQRSVVSWTTMILGCVQNGECEPALELFDAMKDQGLKPEARTYVAALNACSALARAAGNRGEVDENGEVIKLKSLERGGMIHSELKNRGYDRDVFVANSLVDMYTNCGCVSAARSVFDEAVRSMSSAAAIWTSMILGYVECGENRTALELFERMLLEKRIRPEARTFVAAIKACGNLADLETGRRIHEQILRRKDALDLDHHSRLILSNALIAFYGKCGCMEAARLVFESVPCRRRDRVTWSSIIAGYSNQGDAGQVFDLFERMQQAEIDPDGVTFLSVLSACNHAGLVDDAKRYFRQFLEECSDSATIQHYSCMVDLLSRAYHLEEAVAIVETMPMEPDFTVWTSILASRLNFLFGHELESHEYEI